MSAKFFVDTNILVYAASDAPLDRTRRDVALELLDRPDIVISAQVLAEFYVVATSKTKLNLPYEVVAVLLKSLARLPVCPITGELVLEAVGLQRRYQISYWDAAIIAAAKRMECIAIYSEDLNAGQSYDGVTVVNPFANLTP